MNYDEYIESSYNQIFISFIVIHTTCLILKHTGWILGCRLKLEAVRSINMKREKDRDGY